MAVKAVCINDSNRPSKIPISKWVVKGEQYTITHIFRMVMQQNTIGVELAEFDISQYAPYNCYSLSRFAIQEKDLDELEQMMVLAGKLNNIKKININDFTIKKQKHEA